MDRNNNTIQCESSSFRFIVHLILTYLIWSRLEELERFDVFWFPLCRYEKLFPLFALGNPDDEAQRFSSGGCDLLTMLHFISWNFLMTNFVSQPCETWSYEIQSCTARGYKLRPFHCSLSAFQLYRSPLTCWRCHDETAIVAPVARQNKQCAYVRWERLGPW